MRQSLNKKLEETIHLYKFAVKRCEPRAAFRSAAFLYLNTDTVRIYITNLHHGGSTLVIFKLIFSQLLELT